jgi:threonyl-tRNA synthetase
MAVIVLPDGSRRDVPDGSTPLDAAKSIGKRLAQDAVAARANGVLVDLSRPLAGETALEILTEQKPEALDVLRHSAAHVMAAAVRRLYPKARFWVGPAIESGFYYDIDIGASFRPEDLAKIEAEMAAIIREDVPFERFEKPRDEALRWAAESGQTFKADLIRELPGAAAISFYRNGDFTDLCAGPHVPSTGRLRAFKLLNVTGAYYKGDARNPMLQRIYGVAFFRQSDLDGFLKAREEAEKRDHRRIGVDLDLFSIHPDIVGGGLIHWHPKGGRIRSILEDYWRALHCRDGYEFVYTPHIASEETYRVSGHLEKFSELLYSPMDIDGRPYRVKPMNCPGHILIYKSRLHSYRDLPIRMAELGTVYRCEQSGELHGLKRVRGFTQDDAHIFCTPEQLEAEILGVFRLMLEFLGKFGFKDFHIFLSTRPEKSIGTPEEWDRAIASLRAALDKTGYRYDVDEGGGAFYGPKIDVKIKDAIGREWQCSTIQFDFNLPARFDIEYRGADGKAHRPYMVHRAIMGSLERFFGVLIEHYGGAFPLWIAPVQVTVIPITEKELASAEKAAGALRAKGIRVEVNADNERISYKIRQATLQKVPYMAVVGAREASSGTVAVRERSGRDLGEMPLQAFIARLDSELSGAPS